MFRGEKMMPHTHRGMDDHSDEDQFLEHEFDIELHDVFEEEDKSIDGDE